MMPRAWKPIEVRIAQSGVNGDQLETKEHRFYYLLAQEEALRAIE